MVDSKASESDMDLNDSFGISGKSNLTTDDELFDELMKLPIETPTYLIPDKCHDETEAIEHIMQCFSRRYQNYPVLFIGTLAEALKDALKAKQLEERVPLLIFVNHDKSVYANLFFRQLLCQEKTIEYIAENYLLWGWDVTFPSNCNKLNEIFKNSFPRSSNQIVFTTDNPDLYPSLIAVYRDVLGENVYELLHDGSLQQLNPNEFLTLLRQFKEKFVNSEQDLEKRRETLKNEMAARTASMQRHHFKRYHSMHPNLIGTRDYRAYLSMDHSNVLNDPDFMANMNEDLFDGEMQTRFAHAFKQIPKTPEDADDEEDDDLAQTPTVERPEPNFQRIKKV